MRVTSLKLTNFRAIETAEFRFQPGFNLIVGVNGVGKSTGFGCVANLHVSNPPFNDRVTRQGNILFYRGHTFRLSILGCRIVGVDWHRRVSVLRDVSGGRLSPRMTLKTSGSLGGKSLTRNGYAIGGATFFAISRTPTLFLTPITSRRQRLN